MGEIGSLEDTLALCQGFLSCTFWVDLGLRIFKLAGFSFSSCGDGAISIFHHPSFTCKEVGLAKMCRLMVCNITDVMSTQQIQIKVLCLTDHVREEEGNYRGFRV